MLLIFNDGWLIAGCCSVPVGIKLCVVYLVFFLRAFSRALKILRSQGGVLFPRPMSSARSRAERAEIGRASIGDDGVEGESRMGGGGLSTASMTEASAAGSGSEGGEEDVEAAKGGPEEIV